MGTSCALHLYPRLVVTPKQLVAPSNFLCQWFYSFHAHWTQVEYSTIIWLMLLQLFPWILICCLIWEFQKNIWSAWNKEINLIIIIMSFCNHKTSNYVQTVTDQIIFLYITWKSWVLWPPPETRFIMMLPNVLKNRFNLMRILFSCKSEWQRVVASYEKEFNVATKPRFVLVC